MKGKSQKHNMTSLIHKTWTRWGRAGVFCRYFYEHRLFHYSVFCRNLTVLSICMPASTQCELWEVPWTLLALHSFPPRKTNIQKGREAEKREKEADEKEQNKNMRVRGADGQTTLGSKSRELSVCEQKIIIGVTVFSPPPRPLGIELNTLPASNDENPHPNVFIQKTACNKKKQTYWCEILHRLSLQRHKNDTTLCSSSFM